MESIVFDKKFHDLVDGSSLVKVGDDFGFPEGPVMLPDGYLVFSDVTRDKIIRFSRPDRTGIYRYPSGGANGNTLDLEGRLITCQPGTRNLTRTEHDGSVTVVADKYQGKRLNAPNDVVVKSDGSIYFTDPIFLGDFNELLGSSYMALGLNGVFSVLSSGEVCLLTDEVEFPNGLAFSPDESILYVANTSDHCIYAFNVSSDGSIANMRRWLDMSYHLPGVADGMKVDINGNAYCTGPGGVWVADANGSPLGIIRTPTVTTNVAFYGFDSRVLFITAPPALYMVRLKVPGISVIDRVIKKN